MHHSNSYTLIIPTLAFMFSAAADAQVIGIDFQGIDANNYRSSPMGANETAGVVPRPNWNSFDGHRSITPRPLVNDAGLPTGASASWDAIYTWNARHPELPGDFRMMKGYLDQNRTSIVTISVTGLPPEISAVPYSVIVYYEGENGATGAAVRVGKYSIGTQTYWGRDPGDFNGTYVRAQTPIDPLADGGSIDNNELAALAVPAGNYLMFSGLTGDSFTLVAEPSVSNHREPRAPVNGIQILPDSLVPEPSALTFLALFLTATRRRR